MREAPLPELESPAQLGQDARVAAPSLPPRAWYGIFACTLLGLVLRVWLAADELWLDEIWSLGFALEARSVGEIFTLRHDNNHPLNTLWLYCIGDHSSAFALRALSIAASTLAIPLGSLWTARVFDPRAALPAALILACSTLLAYYGSEARGYGLAMALGFAAALSLESNGWRRTVGFGLLSSLGLLAHFSFVFLLAALFVQQCARRAPWKQIALDFAEPLLASVLWYLVFVRSMQVGGGDAWSLKSLAQEGLQLVYGLPYGVIKPLVFAAGVVWLAWALRRELPQFCLLLALVVVPCGLTFGVLDPAFVALRYFLLPLSFVLVLAAGALSRRGHWGWFLLLVLAAANLLQSVQLARAGRGQFRAAIRWMEDHSQTTPTTVSSDLAFDTRKVLEYHTRHQPVRNGLVWYEPNRVPAGGVEWVIIATGRKLGAEFIERGQRYRSSASFAAAGPSSYSWVLYQRVQ